MQRERENDPEVSDKESGARVSVRAGDLFPPPFPPPRGGDKTILRLIGN